MGSQAISKWFFKDFKYDLKNLIYLKQIPFLCWSDLDNPKYEIIEKVLDRIGINKDLLISVGQNQAPFGMTVNFETDKELEQLLNSATYIFCLTDKQKDTDFLIKSVMCGVIPICDKNHTFIKGLGLERFSCEPDYKNVLDLMYNIKYYQKINDYKIALLSWKYRNQWKKWNKEK